MPEDSTTSAPENSTDTGTGTADTTTTDAPQWTPPSSQADLDRIVQDRLSRLSKQYGMTPDEVKALKERTDQIEFDLSSEAERQAKQASDDGFNAAMSQVVPRLVRAEFRAEAKGVLSADQLEALLEDVDLTRYVDDDGEPDTARIAAKIAKLAPAKDDKRDFPDLGAGNRGGTTKAVSMNDLIRQSAGRSA